MTATAYDVISPVDESVVESVPFADAAAVDADIETLAALEVRAVQAFTETKNVFISTEE
jgi:acyl-CoA reductase-like NAD-dependent aldehyde dehydrogenase